MVRSYLTLAPDARIEAEVTDRKSRFIAQLSHVGSEAEADAFLSEVRSRHHDARHNVPAWILSSGIERCSDDGEPSRTAGQPTLGALRAAGLADVCCVVTRYFGGVLLGPGGLVRAYEAAAKASVARAREEGVIREMTIVTRVVAELPYGLYDRVLRLAEDAGGHVRDSVFAEDVQLTLAFHAGDEAPFVSAVTELASGEELCRVGETGFAEL